MRLNVHLIGALVALMALSACGGGPSFLRGGSGGSVNGGARGDRLPNRPAPFVAKVSRGQVVVDGPMGFCVDSSATQDTAQSSFVLMGNCASLSSAKIAESNPTKALLSASLATTADGVPAEINRDALSAYFDSDAGRVSVSREDAQGPVNIIETFYQDDVFYIYVDDGGVAAKDLDPSYWRAILVIEGRLTSLTVQDFASQKMSDADGLQLMQEFVATMRAANGGPDVTPPPATPRFVATEPSPAPRAVLKPLRALSGVGLLRRILQ